MNIIKDMDYTKALPPVLCRDEDMVAIAKTIAHHRKELAQLSEKTMIFPLIDKLPEDVLDILAYDLKIEWYGYDYPIEVMRRTIKNSFKIHRRKGTKYAVETTLSEVFPGATVEEWFEYGGAPYTFSVNIPVEVSEVSVDKMIEVIAKIKYYKNLRSHLDKIRYVTTVSGNIFTGGAYLMSNKVIVYPKA